MCGDLLRGVADCDLLRPLAPKPLTPLAKTIDRLGDLLGDDHDLGVLRREVAGDPARFGGPEALEPLLARIDRRRQKLSTMRLRWGAGSFGILRRPSAGG